MKCQACGHVIKNEYNWDGQILGIDCWKRIALPEIEKLREVKDQERKDQRLIKSRLIADTLAGKDFSKISSRFKLDFSASIIEQVNAGRMLSNKQIEIAVGFFNGKDDLRYEILQYATGIYDDLTHVAQHDKDRYFGGKLLKEISSIIDLPAQLNWYGDPVDTVYVPKY